jgi:hypothetical protein
LDTPAPDLLRRAGFESGTAVPEFGDESGALLAAEATDATRRRDAEPIHDLRGSHLANAGQRLEQCGHPHLPDHVVFVTHFEDGTERLTGVLEACLDLGASLPRNGSFRKRVGTLLGGEDRECHEVTSNGRRRKAGNKRLDVGGTTKPDELET